ncbi:hypothetical protein OHT52_04800 [Streptomyces sp. NBC_00247]|uniref:hypothetical protein n=1 Tax=Streptomyces sp. NBC_00247 TaxID=2975689 RepID=UPI002E2A7EAA|nr:hypothetical protein [Streptomyces sp. NBC_00247]
MSATTTDPRARRPKEKKPFMRGARVRMPGPTAPAGRRVMAGVGALTAALVLAVLPIPPGGDTPASAAEQQSSAVTKTGKKGAYDDFSQLKVTVSQTKDLRGQAVKVSWTGATPATTEKAQNFMQLMQCWGDDPDAGPSREQCEFGATVTYTPGSTRMLQPTTDNDPAEGDYEGLPDEPMSSGKFVPFRPVSGAATTDAYDYTYFTGGDTNTLAWLPNDSEGSGEASFEVRTSVESPHLGCGARRDAAGAVQPCWLVAVPRGEHNPDGRAAQSSADPQAASPLSRTIWDQRLVFRLDFLPVGDNCAADMPERRTIGSELVTDAMTSWQSKLCVGGTHRFTFTQAGEESARSAITAPTDTSPGLAFTVDPVESDGDGAPVVHAPVAVSGLTIGFLWNYESGTDSHHVSRLRLNQRLLAKLLTESYVENVRMSIFGQPEPDTVAGNPVRIAADPEFLRLNPEITAGREAPNGLVVGLENSDTARLLWRYIIQNDDARAFLEGKPDPWGMHLNTSYEELDLTEEPFDYYPKSDATATPTQCEGVNYGSQDLVPYANDMHSAALKIRRGYSGLAFICNATTQFALSGTRPELNNAHEIGIADTASAERYLLDVAALPNADGTFVKPTTATMLKAVTQMPDSAVPGVKAPDPAKARGSAYPLTSVVYAAASTDQSADARTDYARVIRYAAGDGQTPGTAPGELPAGYAPLPQGLRTQALTAATALEKGVVAEGGTSADGGSSGEGDGGTTSGGGYGTGGTKPASSGSTGGATGASGSTGTSGASAASGASGAAAAGGTAAAVGATTATAGSGTTPSELLGAVRWVLLGVLVLGGAASLSGPLLLRLSTRRGGTEAAGVR